MPDRPTVAALLPARVRAWIYAVLAALIPAYEVARAAYDLPAWAGIVVAFTGGAGFAIANHNTPTPEDQP